MGSETVCGNFHLKHLEHKGNLSTNNFILVEGRFISRQEHQKQRRSDDGYCFVGAKRELKVAVKALN